MYTGVPPRNRPEKDTPVMVEGKGDSLVWELESVSHLWTGLWQEFKNVSRKLSLPQKRIVHLIDSKQNQRLFFPLSFSYILANVKEWGISHCFVRMMGGNEQI